MQIPQCFKAKISAYYVRETNPQFMIIMRSTLQNYSSWDTFPLISLALKCLLKRSLVMNEFPLGMIYIIEDTWII